MRKSRDALSRRGQHAVLRRGHFGRTGRRRAKSDARRTGRRISTARARSGWRISTARAGAGFSPADGARADDSRAWRPCAACHGADARGDAQAGAPDLLYQDPAYLALQMRKYRDGLRGGPGSPPMAAAMAAFAAPMDGPSGGETSSGVVWPPGGIILNPTRPIPVDEPSVSMLKSRY